MVICSNGATVYSSYNDLNDKKAEIKNNQKTIDGLIKIIKDFRNETKENFDSLNKILISYGWLDPGKAKLKDIEESMKANQYRNIYSQIIQIRI